MKTGDLSPKFAEAFFEKPVAINTKIEISTDEGTGLVTYRGILVDYDDFMVYIGNNEDEVSTAVKWNEISSIEHLDLDAEAKIELLKKEPASGAVS